MKKFLLILSIFILTGCVTAAFGLDPYTNLTIPERSNISFSSKNMEDTEKCLHTNWAKQSQGVRFPLTITYNQNGKVLAFVGILNSRFFAIEISESNDPKFITRLNTAITSDPAMNNKESRSILGQILDTCSTRSDWTTL